MDATFCGRPSFRLVLAVDRYAYPENRQGPDADWLDGYVHIEGGGVSTAKLSIEIAWRTEEILGFQREISALLSGEKESAVLEHLEEMVSATFVVGDPSSFRLNGYVTDAAGLKVSFDQIEVDRAELQESNAQLARLVERYPARDPELCRRMRSRTGS